MACAARTARPSPGQPSGLPRRQAAAATPPSRERGLAPARRRPDGRRTDGPWPATIEPQPQPAAPDPREPRGEPGRSRTADAATRAGSSTVALAKEPGEACLLGGPGAVADC
jgi:hypothetical protein